jgi:hypothetical protein
VTEPLKAVEADANTPDGSALVVLHTDTDEVKVTIPPVGKWRTRANRLLREADFDGWAKAVLSDEDWEAWEAADPTNDDVEEFFKAWGEVTGENRGKSSRSSASSRSTAKP